MSDIDVKKLQGWPFLWFGLGATLIYVLFAVILLGEHLLTLHRLQPNEIGDTLAGVFAPLALIWLIVGILQQGRELRIQVQDLKESVEAQKAMAKASGGQERLQNEQFLERLYRLYKSACEDVLYQLTRFENLQRYVSDNRGRRAVGVLSREFVQAEHAAFNAGNRARVLLIVRELNRVVAADHDVSMGHARFLMDERLTLVRSLAEDFLKFDVLRREALARFEGGEVLGRVDDHEGFEEARKLATIYSLLGPPT
jgi:hypothetical protein